MNLSRKNSKYSLNLLSVEDFIGDLKDFSFSNLVNVSN